MSIAEFIVGLGSQRARGRAASALAARVGAECVLLFVRDAEVGAMLPAAGLPQTVRGGAAWRALLARCTGTGRHAGDVDLTPGPRRQALAITVDEIAVVFIGAQPSEAQLCEIECLLPLLAAALHAEQRALFANAQAVEAKAGANRAQALADALEAARAQGARLHEHLRESENRFRTLTAMASDWYWEQDEHFRYLDISDGFEMRAGTPRAPYSGKTRWELPNAGVSEEQWAEHRALLERHEPFRDFEYQRITERGDMIWASVNGDPIFDADGRFKGYRGTGSNITKRKEAEAALREADRRKDEFLATLAHELRNPLAPLRNALHLVRITGEGGAGARPLHDMMERQVGHMIRLVDDLLEQSRITRGSFELRKERIQVATIVVQALETADPLIQAAGHRVSVALPQDPLWIDADTVRLTQILANLLNNAASYTPRGGQISISAGREDATVAVSVRDNGAGIAPEQLSRIFGMFSKGERSKGLGVGLALARRLAEMHGGTVEASSEGPGRGAEFTVRLPLAQAPGVAQPSGPAAGAAPTNKRILVVDDNRDAGESLAALLKEFGADVQSVCGGQEALVAFTRWRPQIVLLDLGMPGMDGYEVARRLKQRGQGAPLSIVALTGWGQDQDRKRARDAGCDHHLVKPVDIGDLRELIASIR